MNPENSETPELPTDSENASQASEDKPSYTHRGNGFVARLPKAIRDEINRMILDGVPYGDILDRIGEPAKHINEDHVRNWKAHGYQSWLEDLQRNEALRATRESAIDLLDQKAGVTVQDAGRTIAGAQLYELLLSYDPTALVSALGDKPELYLRIINSLARLSEGEAVCLHRRTQDSLIETKRQSSQPDGKNLVAPETLKEIARLIKLL